MTPRDNAAYKLLLDRVRDTPHAQLHDSARRDVRFSQLFENPDRFRGLPLHIDGTTRRVLIQHVEGSPLFHQGRYYEAWTFTPDSMAFPYVLAFENAPANLAIGDNIQQRVQFDGYFLKILAYMDGTGTYRAAPLIVGRFPPAQTAPTRGLTTPPAWLRLDPTILALVVLLSAYALFRVVTVLARLRRSARQPSIRIPRVVSDRIEPDELSAWIESPGPQPDTPSPTDPDSPP
jgi:hypothetical protein